MTHGSLFSGIGGFDLAAEWMGWENIFHCEWMPFPRKILKYYWPNSISYENICTTDFSIHRGKISILTGGFPCQPYSTAGKRKGKEDERHLWPEMLRAIREIKPRWVVGENVRGLVSWSDGLVFEEVQSDLEAQGYEVQPFLLPACGVNAPHRRDRIWFIAYANDKGGSSGFGQIQRKDGEISEWNNDAKSCNTSDEFITNSTSSKSRKQTKWKRREDFERGNSNNDGIKRTRPNATNADGIGLWGESYGIGKSIFIGKNEQKNNWENFPTVSPICNGDDGLSDRLDSITFSKWRAESIKGGGNAIVPQVALQIFKAIEEFESLKQPKQ